MRYFYPFLFLIFLPQLSFAQEEKEQVQLIHQCMQQFPDKTQFAVALIDGNEVRHLGFEKSKGKILPTKNAQHVFQIGSLSKVFTTHLLLKLIQAGKIESLDAKVRENTSLLLKGNPDFTFRQLASHSSGLPADPDNLGTTIFNARNPYKEYTAEKLKDYLAERLELEAAPGTAYKYSNLGMTLLGYVLSEISGQNYEELLQAYILRDLNMTSTSTDASTLDNPLTLGYNKKGKETPYWEFKVVAPAGAILSTTEDLTKYVQGSFIALEKELAAMREVQIEGSDKMEVALAWHVIKGYSQSPFLWHNGGTGGFKSSLGLNPDSQKSVIILTNVGRSSTRRAIDTLCYELMKSLE